MHTLMVCRAKVTKNGFAGQSLGDQPALLLLRGKCGRSESPPADVAEAVNALMQAVHFPAAAFITTQVSTPACQALTAKDSWIFMHVLNPSTPYHRMFCTQGAPFAQVLCNAG